MQTLTPQQQLANRLYELLPHKKELEFGCLIKNKKDSDSECAILCMNSLGLAHIIERINDGEIFWQKNEVKYDDIEIIGQPLRLTDLLLAITGNGIKRWVYVLEIKKWISTNGQGISTRELIVSMYNLQDDNILNQSNELCEFALDLLK